MADGLPAAETDRLTWSLIHAQREYIGPCIVPHRIEVQARARQFAKIQLGDQDRFAFVVRARKKIAERARKSSHT